MPHRSAIITALLLERPLCMDCVCAKSGMKPVRVNGVLANIGRVLNVRRLPQARCRACGEDRPTVSIDAVP
jgi:hypothetical protein